MYKIAIKTSWANCDANGHVKNTAYSEFATHNRFSYFEEKGFPPKELTKLQIGPVITREEALFYREVNLMENIEVSCELLAASKNYSRYSFIHYVFKENGKKAAQLIVEGLWLDLKARKPAILPDFLQQICESIPKAPNFEWITSKR